MRLGFVFEYSLLIQDYQVKIYNIHKLSFLHDIHILGIYLLYQWNRVIFARIEIYSKHGRLLLTIIIAIIIHIIDKIRIILSLSTVPDTGFERNRITIII